MIEDNNDIVITKHFVFQLSDKEIDMLVSQNAIPSRKHLGGSLPYGFTEYRILQSANFLRSEQATILSIRIIEVFVKMRELMFTSSTFTLTFLIPCSILVI